MIQAREPLVDDDVIGFMDGCSFLTECTSKRVQQNAFHCGYNCNTMVNNVFSHGPDGKVLTFPEVGLTAFLQHGNASNEEKDRGI
jgi:hypothetical protein